MRQRIENRLVIDVEGIDLTTVTGIRFWIRQAGKFFEYVPVVTDAGQMIVVIPKDDAMRLTYRISAEVQFAYTDADGNPGASDVLSLPVAELLKTEGYDGID